MKRLERILRNLQRVKFEPRFRKRLFGFLALGVLGLFLTGGLVMWGAIATYRSLANFSVSPRAQNQLDGLKKELGELPVVNSVSCFEKIQTLVDFRPWIANPVLQNLSALKSACLETKAGDCNGPECANEPPSIENRKRQTI